MLKMPSGIEYNNLPSNPRLASQALDIEKQDKEFERKLGYLGKLFGNGENVTLYIISSIVILILIVGCLYSFFPRKESLSPTELRKILTPFLTVGIGFIAGRKTETK